MIQKICFLFLLVFCLSCQSEPKKQSDEIADKICACYKDLIEINTEIEAMLKSGNGNRAEKMINDISTLNLKAQACTSEMVKQYGSKTQLDIDLLGFSMREKCPKVWTIVKDYIVK